MSYILDALKKAEMERDPDTRVSLAMAQHQSNRQRLLLYGVIVALLANAIVLVWLFFPDADPSPALAGPQPAAVSAAPAAASRPEPAVDSRPRSAALTQAEQPVEPAPVVASAPAAAPAREAPLPARVPAREAPPPARTAAVQPPPTPGSVVVAPPAPEPLPPGPEAITLAGLPEAARARFPALDFSTHIYADDPTLRAVVVNGIRLVEGDVLAGMLLHEITATGTVFAFEDYLVSVGVLDDWD